MIKSFADHTTEEVFVTGRSRRLPPDILRRAIRKLDAIDAAAILQDLAVPPGNRLHALEGTRGGQHSISINDQWRICFVFKNGDAFDVEITDYHS
jgi:proteic killer suppression protein